MPAWLLPAILGGASLFGGALSNRGRQATSRYSNTTTSTPTLDPQFGPLQQMLLQNIQGRLSQSSALPQGYETGGIQKINNAFDVVRQSQQNNLTARGLGSSPIAGNVDATRDFQRAGQVGQFQAGLPGVERDFRNQDMGIASLLLNQGRGTTTTSSGTGTQTQPGNMAGGAFDSLASMLGWMIGTGQFGGATPTMQSRTYGTGMGFGPTPLGR